MVTRPCKLAGMNAIFDLPELRARVRTWTVEEYEKLGDDPAFRRTELIRGTIVNKMSKGPLHSTILADLYLWLVRTLAPGWYVRQEQPLRLTDSMPEPDIAVVHGTSKDFATRHPATAVLVVEVADSSIAADREKAALYAEAGVGEYWIVLAGAGQVEVYRRPEGGEYRERRTYARGEEIGGVVVLDGGSVATDALFA